MLLSERQIDLDPVYDWYRRHGLGYFIGSRLVHDDQTEIVWSLQRSMAQGHAQKGDVEVFELLKGHVATALGLGLQIGTLRSYRSFGSAMLEALPQAVLALGPAGQILFANARGADLLGSRDGLSIEDGRLVSASPVEQVRLDQLMRGAADPLIAGCGGWARVSRPSGKLAYAVFVAPLRVEDSELLAVNARVLVLVHDPSEQRCADAGMLVSLYGLTETEARLASALSGGHSLESAAAMLGIRPATARTHLKHVFRKLGVNRQQDLVRLLGSLSTVTPLA